MYLDSLVFLTSVCHFSYQLSDQLDDSFYSLMRFLLDLLTHMRLIPDTNHYLAIFVELDRLVYHNPENLTQAGGIGEIERNVADLLEMKGMISIARLILKEKSSGIPGLHGSMIVLYKLEIGITHLHPLLNGNDLYLLRQISLQSSQLSFHHKLPTIPP